VAYPQRVDSKLAGLAIAIGNWTDSAPTQAQYRTFEKLKGQAEDSITRWSELEKTDLVAFEKMMAGQNIQAIAVPAAESEGSRGEGPK